jgi:predicted transcriptional regulator
MYGNADLLHNTGEIVRSYVSRSSVTATELPNLISKVHAALVQLGTPVPAIEETPVAAVSIKKSITPDYLICLDDGKQFKSLKRHIAQLGMTPDQYRTKWGLPSSYPMVAPAYAERRSILAKQIGLGRKIKVEPVPTPAPKRARKQSKAG